MYIFYLFSLFYIKYTSFNLFNANIAIIYIRVSNNDNRWYKLKEKKKWIALSEYTYELLKNEGKFLESFDDVVIKILTKKDSTRQSSGFGES